MNETKDRLDTLLEMLAVEAARKAGVGDDEFWPDYDRIDMQITDEIRSLRTQLARAEAERDALARALEYYASGIVTQTVGPEDYVIQEAPDDGTTARAALDKAG